MKLCIVVLFVLTFINMGGFLNTSSNVKNDFTSPINLRNPELSASEITIISPENKTYTTPMDGYYSGTIGFESDKQGDIPQGWIDDSGGSCFIDTFGTIGGHHQVLRLVDNSGTYQAKATSPYFTAQTSGTIEYWIYVSDATDGHSVILDNSGGANRTFLFSLTYDGWYYFDGAVWIAMNELPSPNDNTWYHVKVHFECSTGGYQGLSQFFARFEVDGVVSNDYEFENYLTYITLIQFSTITNHIDTFYIDSIGYSWDSDYNIGDNLDEGLLLSFDNSTNLDWIGYSLDGQANRTIFGNTTFILPNYGLHNIKVYGNTSQNIMYESELRFFSISPINIITPENTTYTNNDLGGYYMATYGFDYDFDGGIPEDWGGKGTGGCSAPIVISELDGHKKVVQFTDNSGSGQTSMGTTYSVAGELFGTFEYWVYTTDATKGLAHTLRSSTDVVGPYYTLRSDKWLYFDGASNQDIIGLPTPQDNTWIHVKVHYDCRVGGGYEGLGQYEYKIVVDENETGALPFVNPTILGHTNYFTISVDSGYQCYIDAVGFSWELAYSIGDNLQEGMLLSFNNNTNYGWIGYSIDGQSNITMMGNTIIQIYDNGLHSIQLTMNDTLGKFYVSELRYFTLMTTKPEIIVTTPSSSQFFGVNAPSYSIDIQGINLDKMWCSLDGGITNITIESRSGTIRQSIWNSIAHGSTTIYFFANDSLGRLGMIYITINKDINPPSSSIIFTAYDLPNQITPTTSIHLSATDGIDSGISFIEYKINNGNWNTYIGPFTLVGYDPGVYTITFRAIDAVGNIELEQFINIELVIPPPPPPDPTFMILLIIGISTIAGVILLTVIYATIIRPKTAESRELKKNKRIEKSREKRELKEKVRQEQLEQQRLEQERIVKERREYERLKRERIEQMRRKSMVERQRHIELEKQRKLGVEREQIEKISKMMSVSSRIKINLVRNYLKMDEKSFNQKLIDWANQFGFTIDGEYLNISKENANSFVDELEQEFSNLSKLDIIVCPFCQTQNKRENLFCTFCGQEFKAD